MRKVVFALVLLFALVARGDFVLKQGGSTVGTARDINCGTNMTCSISGVTATFASSGSGGSGGSGAPVDAGYVVLSGHSSGSTNERTLSAGNYTSIDTGTAGQVQIDWAHGLACTSGQALVSSGTSAMACTSTLIASDVQCGAACVADSELVSNYSGTGACGANTWASTLNDNASPTCTQPAFSNLSGTATTAQLPTITVAKGGTGQTTITTNQVYVGTALDTLTAKTLPSCSNGTTSKLLFDNSTQTWSCGTDQTGGGGGGASPYLLAFGAF